MSRPKKEGKKNIRKDISMDPEQYERLMDYFLREVCKCKRQTWNY